MKSFSEKERCCEATFFSGGPFWLASTPGKETPILFVKEDDYIFAMNVVAQASALFPDVKIYAFEVMNNHFHFVLSGIEERVRAFWAFICKRLARTFSDIRSVEIDLKPITTLDMMRNCIAYTNRNGYVANVDCTPYGYKWGTGRFYFQDIPFSIRYSDIFLGPRREMFRGRDPKLPEDWYIIDGYVAPPSFCAISAGMAMFRDAHNYFLTLTKNVEAYRGIAAEIDDKEFLTDGEMYDQLRTILKDKYKLSRPAELSKAQKLDLARIFHYDYHSSNGQIRRMLNLSEYEVNQLFPICK